MKKVIILCLCFLLISALFAGCKSKADLTEDNLFGKGYKERFYAFTIDSAHPGDGPVYCLTEDSHLILAATGNPPQTAHLKSVEFDAALFKSYFTDLGYWQDSFTLEYVCEQVDKAWYGTCKAGTQALEGFCYLLLLNDGTLLLAKAANPPEYNGEPDTGIMMLSVTVIEQQGSQQEYFEIHHTLWQDLKESWPESYLYWEKLYQQYS